jgi:hypothetical protein
LDPLKKVRNTTDSGLLPTRVYKLINDRFHLVTQGILRVERATGIKYPLYYVEPNLVVSTSETETGQFGIFFARTIPMVLDNHLTIVIQVTAPLVIYGLLGTIHAILAHEFIHYLQLMSKIIKMEILSDEISRSLFEQKYADHTRLLQEKVVFQSDPTLIRHILRKFPVGFKDNRLEDRVLKEWMYKGLPVTRIPVESNVIRLPIDKIASLQIDPALKEKIYEFESEKFNGGRIRKYV